MSEYDLIPEEVYDNLPEDDHDKFALLVRTAQASLVRMLGNEDSREYANEVRAQFMSILRGHAEALEIDGLPDFADLADYSNYTRFQTALAGVTAKVRLKSKSLARPNSVQLSRITKARIIQEIGQLRYSVENSELEPWKIAKLVDMLDKLDEEVNKQRLSFSKTLSIVAIISTTFGGASTGLANAPKASETIGRILEWIGEDKEREDAERERLAPPPKAIAAPEEQYAASRGRLSAFDSDLDDDVPF